MTTQDYLMILGGGFAFGLIAGRLRFHLIPTLVALLPFVVLAVLFLSGCTPTVKHEVPQLDGVGEAVKKIVIQDCQKPIPSAPLRASLAMPPIPQECVIDIRGDVLTASSQECEDLIRHYVKARQLLRPAGSVGAP